MVIVRNIPAAVKLLHSVRLVSGYKKEARKAASEGNNEKQRKIMMEAGKIWSSYVLDAFDVDLNITGKENLPKSGPVVYVANHQGYADILVLVAALNTTQIGFVAKEGLEKMPLFGEWLTLINSVLINRGNPREAAKTILKGVQYLKQGFSLVIFPEGTRSQSSAPNPFKKGALKLATKAKVPVIPVTIDGTYRLYEETGVIRPGHVDVIIHPAMETKDLNRSDEADFAAKIEETVTSPLKNTGD